MKCSIVCHSAPLPLTVQNVGVHCSFVRAVEDAGPYDGKREIFRTLRRGTWVPPRPTGKSLPTSVGGDAHIALSLDRKAPANFVGGGVPDAPPCGAQTPTFQIISGSGAGRKSILHLGTVLQIPRLSAGEDSKTLVLARFWLLFPRGKSNPPEAAPADSNCQFFSKTKNPIFTPRA